MKYKKCNSANYGKKYVIPLAGLEKKHYFCTVIEKGLFSAKEGQENIMAQNLTNFWTVTAVQGFGKGWGTVRKRFEKARIAKT